tara:strand:+ start:2127 stop:2702 length:576 start_codon:yes stop_codon:yes gene_type:complete
MSNIAIKGAATGTGVFTLESPATNTNRTLTLPDEAGTILTTATAGVPIGGPAFSAYLASTQSVTNSVVTKVTINTEVFDTNSCFDNATNYRFTPTVAGYYQVNGVLRLNAGSSLSAGWVSIYKNGSAYSRGIEYNTALTGPPQLVVSDIVYFNGSTDYVELYGLNNANTPTFEAISTGITARFSAAMVRSA